jgi:hypothetical protein
MVEDWLAEIGLAVARAAEFRLGLIGCEVSGLARASDVSIQGIPSERRMGYLWPSGNEVKYYRRTTG